MNASLKKMIETKDLLKKDIEASKDFCEIKSLMAAYEDLLKAIESLRNAIYIIENLK